MFTLTLAYLRSHTNRTQRSPNNETFKPISASSYFDQAIEVSVPESDLKFRVYYTPPRSDNGTVLVCHHGAGYSGLSFSCLAKEVVQCSGGDCGVLSIDCRGHGRTTRISGEPAEEDLTIETLTNDLVNLLSRVFSNPANAPSILVRRIP